MLSVNGLRPQKPGKHRRPGAMGSLGDPRPHLAAGREAGQVKPGFPELRLHTSAAPRGCSLLEGYRFWERSD